MISSLMGGTIMAQAIEMAPNVHALRLSQERPAQTLSGYPMLLVLLLTLVLMAGGLSIAIGGREALGATLLLVGTFGFCFVAVGFYLLQPNQAAAIMLFGDYK